MKGRQPGYIPGGKARRLAQSIPRAELHLLEGAGYVYHSERAEDADAAVLDFLDRVEARR